MTIREIHLKTIADVLRNLRPGDDEDSVFQRNCAEAHIKELLAASPEAPGLTTEQLRSCWRGDADGYPDFAAIALAVDALLASQPNAGAAVMHEPKLYAAEGPITSHEGTYTVASIGCTCGWNSDGESYKKVGDWDAHLHAAPPGQPATEAEERLLKSLEASESKWRKDGLIATADPVEALAGGGTIAGRLRTLIDGTPYFIPPPLKAELIALADDIEALKRDAAFWRDVAEKMGYKLVKGEPKVTDNEIIQRWIQDANAGRIKIGKRELTNDENALIIQVLQCVGADMDAALAASRQQPAEKEK